MHNGESVQKSDNDSDSEWEGFEDNDCEWEGFSDLTDLPEPEFISILHKILYDVTQSSSPLNSGFLRYDVFVNKFGGIDAVQDQILGSLDSDLLKLFLPRDFKEVQDEQAMDQQQTGHIYPRNLQPR